MYVYMYIYIYIYIYIYTVVLDYDAECLAVQMGLHNVEVHTFLPSFLPSFILL
jgi:hypothetical protein